MPDPVRQMPGTNRLVLLIDGNNLAYYLYPHLTRGKKMTPADSLRLIRHLSSYARTYSNEFEIELCLDRMPGELPDLPDGLRVMVADYSIDGDTLIMRRFWYHKETGRPCLVITNDEEMLEEVSEGGGASMRVFHFVRRPGLRSPVFRAPDEILPLLEENREAPQDQNNGQITVRVIRQQAEDRARNHTRAAPLKVEIKTPSPQKPAADHSPAASQEKNPMPVEDLSLQSKAASTPPADHEEERLVLKEAPPAQLTGDQPAVGPYYRIDIDLWPPAEGIEFLRKQFCSRHRSIHAELIEAIDYDQPTQRDVHDLVDLLLQACGDEPNFARRGALMTRVQLALLQARGEWISLHELAARIDLPVEGLRGRIKKKASVWINRMD